MKTDGEFVPHHWLMTKNRDIRKAICSVSIIEKAQEYQKKDKPLIIVARPLAVPIPRPLIAFGPTRLNLPNGNV